MEQDHWGTAPLADAEWVSASWRYRTANRSEQNRSKDLRPQEGVLSCHAEMEQDQQDKDP